MPIQQMLLGVGAVATKTYIDDVFSTFLYEGNGYHPSVNPSGPTSRDIVNGIDFTEGGLAIFKTRNQAAWWQWVDTENGATNALVSNTNDALDTNRPNGLKTFNNNGFTIGYDSLYNVGNVDYDYSAWSFRKAKGFFDVVTWTGNGTAGRQLSHNLGCAPGMVAIKCTSDNHNWSVWHRGLSSNAKTITLNSSGAEFTNDAFNGAAPSSTVIHLSNTNASNASSKTYVAYLWAGGEEGYNSVEFDGTGDKLSIANHSDLQIGSSTYTMEFWVFKNADTPNDYDCWAAKGSNNNGTREFAIESMSDQTIDWFYATSGGSWSIVEDVSDGAISTNQWVHICAQKDSNGYFSFFVNGTRTYYSTTGGATLNTGGDAFCIGGFTDANTNFESNIKISNFRFIKGTALYSSSFTPSTTPLTNVTNTKLLCCNGNLPTSSTVTPGTITANGDTHTTWTSPFISPDAVFGDSGDQNVIKCGSYVGNGSSDGPEINLGWEPSWILHKSSSVSGTAWHVFDCMRGVVTGGNDAILVPNTSAAEASDSIIDITSTGFKITTSAGGLNQNNGEYIWMAIRRPDGYVGKPPELGTDVFAIDTGNGSSTIPNFDSGFPVDFGLAREVASTWSWQTGARLIGGNMLNTNNTNVEGQPNGWKWDSNAGWLADSSFDSDFQAWMWKRHAGFDVVTYKGGGSSSAPRSFPHSLGKAPEMIWTKNRDSSVDWVVWHKGLNGGGNNAASYNLRLNQEDNESSNNDIYGGANNVLPTSTHWTTGGNNMINESGSDFIALLFASVDGISKVGSYSGNNSGQTITTGFQPRFIIIKQLAHNSWYVFDTVRGWSQNNQDWYLRLEGNYAQSDNVNDRPDDIGHPLSTGFYLKGDTNNDLVATNKTGNSYIYYAHA